MRMNLHHVAVMVTDLPRAERFYAGVLGLPVTRRQAHSIWCGLGHGTVLMVERGTPGTQVVALAIARAERETWRARLTAAGHAVHRETELTLYAQDPDGNWIGLSHDGSTLESSQG